MNVLRNVFPYFEGVGRPSLTLAAVSPAWRFYVFAATEVTVGGLCFHNNEDALVITVRKSCPLPPIAWWPVAGRVVIRTEPTCLEVTGQLLELLKVPWSGASVAGLEVVSSEELDDVVQEALFGVLSLLRSTLEVLEVDYLGSCHSLCQLSELRSLRRLILNSYGGEIQLLANAVADLPLDVLEIRDCKTFLPSSKIAARQPPLRMLVLENSNVFSDTVATWPNVDFVERLNLLGCRNIDSIDTGRFPRLRALLLARSGVLMETITSLGTCSCLRVINLAGCRMIKNVNVLATLSSLEELFLHETGVTSDGIVELGRCTSLEKVNLGGCWGVTTVNCLGRLENLKELHLWNTGVTDKGIVGLRNCSSLVELVLDECAGITDVSVLGGLPNLRFLSLLQTEVDAFGIAELCRCPKLETLALAGTRVASPPKLWNHDAIIRFLQTLL